MTRLCCIMNPAYECDTCHLQWCTYCWGILYDRIHRSKHYTKAYGKLLSDNSLWAPEGMRCQPIDDTGYDSGVRLR